MSNNQRKNVSEIRKGDKFKSKWNDLAYEVEHVLEDGKYVVYRKPSGSGFGVAKGETFINASEYKLVVPFFEVGATYKYIGTYGGGARYKIMAVVTGKNGKLGAMYEEVSHATDNWFGTFSENEFKNYTKVTA